MADTSHGATDQVAQVWRGAHPPYGHFGLRSIRDLVEEAGGTLEIASSPYHGTTFCMTLGET